MLFVGLLFATGTRVLFLCRVVDDDVVVLSRSAGRSRIPNPKGACCVRNHTTAGRCDSQQNLRTLQKVGKGRQPGKGWLLTLGALPGELGSTL